MKNLTKKKEIACKINLNNLSRGIVYTLYMFMIICLVFIQSLNILQGNSKFKIGLTKLFFKKKLTTLLLIIYINNILYRDGEKYLFDCVAVIYIMVMIL